MEDLSKYYKKDIFNAVFLDASIINTIQASHASTIMVCAGKTHIDSVRKILQEYGDSKFKTDFNSEVFCHPHHMYLATQKQFSEVLKANDLFFEYINEYYKAQK